jgi:hypothetical protein
MGEQRAARNVAEVYVLPRVSKRVSDAEREMVLLQLPQRGGENAGERILTRAGEQQAQGEQQFR